MINSYNIIPQEVDVDDVIDFEINSVQTGYSTRHRDGASNIKICEPGYYFISFNAVAAPEDLTSAVEVALFNNNEQVPGAISSSIAPKLNTLSFTTIIQVKPSCPYCNNSANLTFKNIGTLTTFQSVNIVVFKIR